MKRTSINSKAKPCKGTGDAKGWGCGTPVLERKYGLGLYCCLKKWMLQTDEGEKRIKQLAKIGERKEEKKKKKKIAKMKNNVTKWRNKTEIKLQLIARLIDKGLPCPARGHINCQIHGGHVLSKGSTKSASLNIHNIHRQSAQSNKWFNDDALFRDGIGREYGLDYLNFILSLKDTPTLKYNNKEYIEFYQKALVIVHTLKKRNRTYNVKERIIMRNVINRAMGVYSKEIAYFEYKL